MISRDRALNSAEVGPGFPRDVRILTGSFPLFLQPQNPTHRQYEALRALFVEGLPSAEAPRRCGYTPGSFRVLVHQFRQDPHRQFFLPPAKGPKNAPNSDRLREKVIALPSPAKPSR